MGSNTLVTKSDGQVISSSDVNQYRTALNQTLFPRNSGGAVADLGGDMGSSTYRFNNAYIKSYNIGDPANSLIIEENVSNQISIKTSGVERVVIDDDGLDAGGLKAATVTQAKMANNSVGTNQLIDSNVTTSKILDANVTNVKLASNSVTTDKILNDNVTTAKIANAAVTSAKRSIDAFTTSSSGAFSTTSTTDTTVTNASIALTPSTRPLKFEVLPDMSASASYIELTYFPNTTGYICLYRDTTKIAEYEMISSSGTHSTDIRLPNAIFHTDNENGSFTYSIKTRVSNTSATMVFNNMRLVATYI